MINILNSKKELLIKELWDSDKHIKTIFFKSKNLQDIRNKLFKYLNELERHYFNIYTDNFKSLHIIEKNNAKECVRVLKNIIRSENEKITNFSAIKLLFDVAKNKNEQISKLSEGFLCEFITLFRGINGNSNIYKSQIKLNKNQKFLEGRSKNLDVYSKNMQIYFNKYKSGYNSKLISKRKNLKNKILNYFNSKESDWNNYLWHMKHIIKDVKTLSSLIKLNNDELLGLKFAEKNNIFFQITPYYLSLFNEFGKTADDSVLRAQVLPSLDYSTNVIENRKKGIDLDFMGEKSTSPIDCITRRYPQIVILKPFDSCPQICVYCQRNWEIKNISDGHIGKNKLDAAISWIKKNKNITEVLITGGDPLTLSNESLEKIIYKVSQISHVERLRIGTRVLVTLPNRINSGFIKILEKYHELGKREICIMTHFEHALEITPDCLKAIKKIKKLGVNIYNQQVFTYYNSKKFETAYLRKILKISGIDPYYSFNTKGKEETIDFRVPIARILQERKEEARLLPGIVRTDEPVFNVPKLGKSHLRAWQDHEPIMILKDGKRVFRFFPWESKLNLVEDYIYTDVSIYDYLKRLKEDGQNIDDYKSIWHYF